MGRIGYGRCGKLKITVDYVAGRAAGFPALGIVINLEFPLVFNAVLDYFGISAFSYVKFIAVFGLLIVKSAVGIEKFKRNYGESVKERELFLE